MASGNDHDERIAAQDHVNAQGATISYGYSLSRWARFCWWLAAALAPKDGSRYGPRIFGRSVKHDA